MKAAVVNNEATTTVALELGDRWIDASRAWVDYNQHVEGKAVTPLADVGDFIRASLMTRSAYRRLAEFAQRNGRVQDYVLLGDLRFRLPLRPGKVLCMGRNYAAHAEELGNEIPTEPLFFDKLPSTCIGPDDAILLPDWCGKVSYEGELGVVIGKTGRNILEADAQEYIAGYTLVNDVTARDLQNLDKDRGHPWTRCKNMDTFCPIGPVVAFRDALPWPVEVDIETRQNGELRQQSNTRLFLFSLSRVIAHMSRYLTLEPGDLISTGTPEGVGILDPGDRIDITVPQIGTLSNPAALLD